MSEPVPEPQRGGRPDERLTPSPAETLASLLAAPGGDRAVLAQALGRLLPGADPATVSVEPLGHGLGSPATAGLYRVRGARPGGRAWSLFCKVLQHPRHWSGFAALPPDQRAHFADTFPWRSEVELWDPVVQASLPGGLRSPALHGLVDLGDDRLAVWQEDVPTAAVTHDLAWFERAAHLLGRWNARSCAEEVLAVSPHPPGYAMRMYAEQAVPVRGLAPLADDELWSHPWLAPHEALRVRLRGLGVRIPALLDRLDDFVPTLPHGDASPQNLLSPADDAAGLVAIDLAFRAPGPVGADLGQLAVGLVHAGAMPAGELPGVAAAIVPAYASGLAAEGRGDVPEDDVREAFTLSALLRSGFDGFLYDLLPRRGPGHAADRHAFDERIRLAGHLVELARASAAADSEPTGTRGTMAR